MNPKVGAKVLGAEIIFRAGLHRGIRRVYGGQGIILALHSVVESPDEYLMSNHYPAALFERTIEQLHRWGFDFVTLDTALEILRGRRSRRFVVLTFDDGFKDNLTIVPRILEKYSAPFICYVTTQMVTRELDAWWLRLQEMLLQVDSVDVEPLGRYFSCRTGHEKREAFAAVAKWVHDDYRRGADIRSFLDSRGVESRGALEELALDEDDVVELSRHPLATIGGHTVSHPALSTLMEDDARREIMENKRFLEGLIQKEITHFAYPFGDAKACGAREAEIAREAGFRTAVTTRHGAIFTEHLESPYALPRIGVHPADTKATMANKAAGVYRLFKSRAGSPVVRM